MRHLPALIGILFLASACATIQPTPSTPTSFPDLSKFKIKAMCEPDNPDKAPFKVNLYLLDHEKAAYNELAFLITFPNTGHQFLSRQTIKPNEDNRKFVFWLKTGGAWNNIGEIDTSITKGGDSKKVLGEVMAAFSLLLPEKYREYVPRHFGQLWRDAGCTTHGPGPFWS